MTWYDIIWCDIGKNWEQEDKKRQGKRIQDKQCEIIGEQKSKEIITHTCVHKNRKLINDSDNNNSRNENTKTRITKPLW